MGGATLSIPMLAKVQAERYALTELSAGQLVYTKARDFISFDNYAQCVCSYKWKYQPTGKPMYGKATFGTIPAYALENRYDCKGAECGGIDGLLSGIGESLYLYITRATTLNDSEKAALIVLSNHLSEAVDHKSYAFYGDDLEQIGTYSETKLPDLILKYFLDKKIFNKAAFDIAFGHQISSRDKQVIFSSKDLWADIPEGYNKTSRDYTRPGINSYVYSFSDLQTREKYRGTAFYSIIKENEEAGYATGISTADSFAQYKAMFGTNSAIYAWSHYFADGMGDAMEVGVAYNAVRITTRLVKSSGAAKKGWLKKLVEFLRKFLKMNMIDDLIAAIKNTNLKSFANALKASDNLLLKASDNFPGRLSIHGFDNGDFVEIAHIENDVLTINGKGLADDGASIVSSQKLPDDIQIKSPNGEDLTGQVEMVTDAEGRQSFRKTGIRSDVQNWTSELLKDENFKKYFDELLLNPSKRVLPDILVVDEEAVLKYYTTNPGYSNFNKALRGEIAMTDKFKAQEKLMNQALEKLPNSIYNQSDELFYRIEKLTVEQIGSIYKEGEILTTKAFTSCTYSREAIEQAMVQREHSVLIRIKGKNGKLIEEFSTLPKEKEILFRPNTTFKVERVYSGRHPLLESNPNLHTDDLETYLHPFREYGQIRIIEISEL